MTSGFDSLRQALRGGFRLAVASVIASSLLAATVSAAPSHAAQHRQQRSLSDDFAIDSYLAGPGASPKVVAATPPIAVAAPTDPVEPAAVATGAAATAEPEQRIASLGFRGLLPSTPSMAWPTIGVITTEYGEVGETSPRGHAGVDIAAPEGTPVRAAEAGEVIKAEKSAADYGWLIVVAHPSGFETWYGHLSSFAVTLGQQVKKGDKLGGMGSTGYSSGSHLHFEVREEGKLRDPHNFLVGVLKR